MSEHRNNHNAGNTTHIVSLTLAHARAVAAERLAWVAWQTDPLPQTQATGGTYATYSAAVAEEASAAGRLAREQKLIGETPHMLRLGLATGPDGNGPSNISNR